MNRRLSDEQIQSTLRELLTREPAASVRAARAALRARWGSSGRTDRILIHWRSERAAHCHPLTADADRVAELERALAQAQARARTAEEGRALAEARAQSAEHRETAHQDHWASKIYELRAELERRQAERARYRELERRVLDLERERVRLRALLAEVDRAAPAGRLPDPAPPISD